jgi:hypothetical protein
MKLAIPQNLKTEQHPFRQIAVTSYIKGGLALLLAIIVLLTVKGDVAAGDGVLAAEKIIAALGLLTLGARSVWRGYKYEYDFSLTDVYDTARGVKVNYLLGQRCTDAKQLASHYSRIMHERSFFLDDNEKGEMREWQSVFYKLTSRQGIAKLFDHLPFPIIRFIANQSGPVALIGFCLVFLIMLLFVSYLGLVSIDMVYFNLAVLIALLTYWQPSKMDTASNQQYKNTLRNRILLFVVFYLITLFFYKSYADGVNIGILLSIVVIAGIMIYTALLSFRLINTVFSKREVVNVETSGISLVNYRVATQPNNILQQFDNAILQLIGHYYRGPTVDMAGKLAGDQNRKGEFTFEYLYETYPKIVSTTYDAHTEGQLSKIWKTGTGLLCAGLVLFFFGVLMLPNVNADIVRYSADNTLVNHSPGILAGLYFILFGVALFFFGNKLVYEVYMFFNMEIFFESNLVLFRASGNYDEFEQINGGIKRKDTFTDFTPNVIVCKVQSSVFVNPYMEKGAAYTKPRFVLSVTRDEDMMQKLLGGFGQNMKPYLMDFDGNPPRLDGDPPIGIE